MNKPTVGRIVHYYTTFGEPNAAIITTVWSDECVNLKVFDVDRNGEDQLFTSVPFSEKPLEDHWSWPPRV